MKRLSTILLACFIISTSMNTLHAQFKWTKSSNNPVLQGQNGDVDNPSGYQQMMHPSVIYDSSAHLYRMWFSSTSMNGGSFSVSTAISYDGEIWYCYLNNPVLLNIPGTWEDQLHCPRVIHDIAGYKMYYTAVQGSSMQLALATSPDGITWTQYGNGPIIPAGATGSWDGMAQCFCDVYYDGQTYYMWYIGVSDYSKGRTIGLATSQDGIHWNKYANNPVLTPTGSGWESASLGHPTVTFSHNMFYMIYGAAPDMGVHWSLGVATSTDGINWNRYGKNPVLTPQAEWEGYSLGGSCLLARDSTFHLWYSGVDGNTGYWQTGHAVSAFDSTGFIPIDSSATWFQDPKNPLSATTVIEPCVIYDSTQNNYQLWATDGRSMVRAISTDGSTWYVSDSVQNISSDFNLGGLYSVSVIKVDTVYYLYYSYKDSFSGVDVIGVATSPDGLTWQNYNHNPIIPLGVEGTWNSLMSVYPHVRYENDNFKMWYGGKNAATNISETGYATSADGKMWVQYTENPIMTIGNPSSCDAISAVIAGLTKVDSTYYMLYTAKDVNGITSTCQATSQDGINWNKSTSNPVLSLGTSGNWNDGQIGGGTLLYNGKSFEFFYCATGSTSGTWLMGHASTTPFNGGQAKVKRAYNKSSNILKSK